MAFDPSKPVQTRGDKANGIPSKPVRILATDLPGDYPIGGLIEGFANLDRWTADGRLFMFTKEVDAYDLINIPERHRKRGGGVSEEAARTRGNPETEEERDRKLDEIVRRIEGR